MNGEMRDMVAADVPVLVALDAAAAGVQEARNPEFVRLALARNPEGCFVITQAGALRAGCCTHAAGPIGVITLLLAQPGAEADTQLAALLRQAVDALGTRHATCLMHAAHDAHQHDLVLIRGGLQVVEPVFVLRRTLAATNDTARVAQSTKNVVWEDQCNVGAYGAELEQAQLGKLLRLRGDEGDYGVAVIELAARKQGGATTTAFVSAGSVVRGLGSGALLDALDGAGRIAQQHGRTQLFCTLNGFYHRELMALVEQEWQVARTVQRWVVSKTIARYKQWLMQPQVDFSYWSL